MGFFSGLILGAVGASIAWFFIARNNRNYVKHFLDLDFNMDGQPDEVIMFLKRVKDKFGK